MEKQNYRFAGSAARATASSRKVNDEVEGLGPLGGDYARDAHRGGLGDDYARDGGGNHEDYARDPDPVKPPEEVPSTAHDSKKSESQARTTT